MERGSTRFGRWESLEFDAATSAQPSSTATSVGVLPATCWWKMVVGAFGVLKTYRIDDQGNLLEAPFPSIHVQKAWVKCRGHSEP